MRVSSGFWYGLAVGGRKKKDKDGGLAFQTLKKNRGPANICRYMKRDIFLDTTF